MNKQEFLKELQNRIRILAETEQQDILAEYAQHIDLRTAAGLSEEEAIRDFGDLGQLAAEILEAYHVDPAQLGGPAQEQASRLPGLGRSLRSAGAAAVDFFRRLGGGIAACFRKLGRGIAGGFRRCRDALKKLFRRRPKPEAPAPEPTKEDPSVNPTPPSRRPVLAGAGRTAGRAVRALGRLCRALLRLAWNLALLLCALPFGLAGMAALICIGLLVVLLAQGYPLAGVLLCCLGAALCCAAVLGLLLTLIWRRPRPAPAAEVPAEAVPAPEEAAEAAPLSAVIARTVEAELAICEKGEDDHA